MRQFSPNEEFAAAKLAQADLYFFSRWMFYQRKHYQWLRADFHKTICDALMRVFNGQCKRLIINIPPRYSKTELAVVNFIAWAMGQVPDAEFIHTSYAEPLAVNNSANIRDMLQHEAYQKIFPGCMLSSDAKSHWKTTAGGVMYATGAKGTITGFGAGKERDSFGGAIIIDDPHKPDEARSDVVRQSVIDWYTTTLQSRVNSSNTPIILIMQRLHEKDLAGWLLDGGSEEEWEHICLPAIQADGTALWEKKHTIERLRAMERAAPYMFSGQYLQSPSPPSGGVIKPDNIQVIDAIPAERIRWVRGWDMGATALDGDYTAGGKLGLLPDGRLIVADMVRGQYGADERDSIMVNTAVRDGKKVKISIPQDPGQAGKTQVLYLTRKFAGYRVGASPESGDKVTRAEPLAAQINVGNVLMLRGAWNDRLIDEMRMFPNGAHDDQVDALSRAYSVLIEGRDPLKVTAADVDKVKQHGR